MSAEDDSLEKRFYSAEDVWKRRHTESEMIDGNHDDTGLKPEQESFMTTLERTESQDLAEELFEIIIVCCRFVKTVYVLKLLEQEKDTWRLLHTLYKDRLETELGQEEEAMMIDDLVRT